MKVPQNKQFKYGSLAISLTVAVVAAVIVINAIVSALAAKFEWVYDMTDERYFEISEAAYSHLDGINKEDCEITVYFLITEDYFYSTTALSAFYAGMSSNAWGMKYIYEIAKQLDEKYENIKLEFVDPQSEHAKMKEILGQSKETVSSLDIIIRNYGVQKDAYGNAVTDSEGKPIKEYSYVKFNRDDFFAFGATGYVEAFKGEYRFISAILNLTNNKQVAYFVTGHGERVGGYTIGSEITDWGLAEGISDMLVDCGYEVRKIDLKYEDFGNEKGIVVIYGPTNDYHGNAESGEIGKINAYLESAGNDMLVFVNPQVQKLENLEAYLSGSFGVTREEALVKDGGENSISVDGTIFLGNAANGEVSEGLNTDRGAKVVFDYVGPLVIGEAAGVTVSPILCAPHSASITDMADGKERASKGEALVALSEKETENGTVSLLLSGTTRLATTLTVDSSVYANRELLQNTLERFGKENIALKVEYKRVNSEILSITKKEAIIFTVIMSALIPLVILSVGTVVYIKRRYS